MDARAYSVTLLVLMVLAAVQTSRTHANHKDPRMLHISKLCRDRLGYFPRDIFAVSTCSLCYFYLVLDSPKFRLNAQIHTQLIHSEPYYLVSTDSHTGKVSEIFPSAENYTSLNDVCTTMTDVNCRKWITCCDDANRCCEQQASIKRSEDPDADVKCPPTFDGWSCWNSTRPGTTTEQTCPSFLRASGSAYSRKLCSDGGSWSVDNGTGLEYTDYTDCAGQGQVEVYRFAIGLGLMLDAIGTVLLSVSVYFFCSSRVLRRQLRVKVHVNLFVSLLLMHVLSLVWEAGVRLDRLTHDGSQSFLHASQTVCKTLLVLHMCSRATVFFWMTCEGCFLHRLLGNSFRPPVRISGYILFGWGVPVLLYIIYGCLRKVLADDDLCWISPLENSNRALDWLLVFAPTTCCILANVVFLVNILKLLTCQMVSHQNEPGNFRKALKAIGMLVPLFGLQQFCLIYRPSPDVGDGYVAYEIASTVILNSQGIIISLVFCFFNAEVRSHVRCPCTSLLPSSRFDRSSLENRKLSFSSFAGSRRTSVSSLQHSSNVQGAKFSQTGPGNSLSAISGRCRDTTEQITSL